MKHSFLLSIIAILTTLILCHCEDDVSLNDAYFTHNGVITGNVPLFWDTPFDTAHPTAASWMEPAIQFDDKVIFGGYENSKGGLCCLNINDGSIVWTLPVVNGTTRFSVVNLNVEDRTLTFLFNQELLSIGKYHMKINIDTGEIIWKKYFEHLGRIFAASDSCYYFTNYLPWNNSVQAVFKIDNATGNDQFFYATDLPPAQGYEDYAPNSYAYPFVYNNHEYILCANRATMAAMVISIPRLLMPVLEK